MNWLERYVEGVKRYLPKKNRDDVGEEIMSVLADKREAEEEKLGREMNEDELKTWIETQEHPMVLAGGYQERPELISRELFPSYLLALKIVLAIVFGLQVFGIGLQILTHNDFTFSYIWGRLFGGLLVNGLLAFASVTLIFYSLGSHIRRFDFLKNWKATSLPEGGKKWITVPVGEKIFEIIAYIFMLGFVNAWALGYWDFWWSDLTTLNPEFRDLVPWINAVIVLELVQNFWVVIQPRWTTLKLAINAILGVFGLYVLTLILGLDPIVSFDEAFVTDHPQINRGEWLNRISRFVLYIVGAVYIYEMGRDLYRAYLLNK